MGCDAFCPLRLVTAGSRVKYKEKRREDSISPTFPRLFYSCDTTLQGTAFLPPPGMTIGRQGGEGGGRFAYMNTCPGSVVILRMALKAVVLQEETTPLF